MKKLRRYLFFDTETSGWPPQGRLVQIAAMVTNEDGKGLLSMDLLVTPVGFEIPEKAVAIHGITTEKAMAEGYQLRSVIRMFSKFVLFSDVVIAHNIQFDMRVLRQEFQLAGMAKEYLHMKNLPQFCTMKSATDFCQIPKSSGGYKWPTLEELYERATDGQPIENAHNAFYDVKAMTEAFFILKREGVFEL